MPSSNLSVVTSLTLAAWVAVACHPGARPEEGSAGSAGSAAPAVGGAANESSSLFDLDPASPSEDEDLTTCAGQVSEAEFVAVDLFIMLDISGSMLELTPSGTEKWAAIRGALESFLSSPSSDGLGVGIQYFPLKSPDVLAGCSSDADCGAGLCMFDTCAGALELGIGVRCQTDLECDLGGLGAIVPLGPCVPMPVCSAAPTLPCTMPGSRCGAEFGLAGTCELPSTGVCSEGPICDARSYATPAVEIATLPDAAPALLASIDAQQPEGGTPSGPALSGAIQLAQEWAASHPGHAVAAVLATDGSPTDCDPVDATGLSELATAGFQGLPSVRTFAIGVFGDADLAAPADLDRIARAGGTESAFIIDSTRDVSTQFLDALNTIRGERLGCEFALPQPDNGGTLDFELVNVSLTSRGTKNRIYRTDGARGCGGDGGWYYDDARDPSRIVLCPASCDLLDGPMAGARVEIQVGCKTVLR